MESPKRKIRADTKTVVVAGHFNPLHVGHIALFKEASQYGRLIVIVANDYQAKQKRTKIFMSEEDRRDIISNLKMVDQVLISVDDDRDVCNTLRVIKPNYFATGSSEKEMSQNEQKVCMALDIIPLFNIGGKKLRSSSIILNNYANTR